MKKKNNIKVCNKCGGVAEREMVLDYSYYCPDCDENLYEFEVTEGQDKDIEKLWNQFEDVRTNEDNTQIEEDFHMWQAGTDISDIWGWFNKNHSKGLTYLFNEYE